MKGDSGLAVGWVVQCVVCGVVSAWCGQCVVWSVRGVVSAWCGQCVVWSVHGVVGFQDLAGCLWGFLCMDLCG